jgi:hypothetical protein
MTDYTPFRLPSGAVVRVQSSLHPPPLLTDEAGVEQASGLHDKARETWEDGVDLVRELAQGIVGKLQEATASVEEVTVEFGVNISGKTGVILVEGPVAANLNVTIKWKGGRRDAAPAQS